MQYMGSKSKISGEIIPILQRIIDEEEIETYVEPFVGGANVIDKIKAPRKVGADKNETLIALLIDAQKGGEKIPESLSREDWDKRKKIYRDTQGEVVANHFPLEDCVAIGATAFLGSFSCRGFSGGMAQDTVERKYYTSRRASLMKQAQSKGFQDVHFLPLEYDEFDPNLKNYNKKWLFYCDPPYQNTKQYGYKFETNFNHEDYWNWVRELSQTAFVVCSEQSFPDDFEIIWEKEVKRTVGRDNAFKATEKLGVLKGSPAHEWWQKAKKI